jgi:hypothetical protein
MRDRVPTFLENEGPNKEQQEECMPGKQTVIVTGTAQVIGAAVVQPFWIVAITSWQTRAVFP